MTKHDIYLLFGEKNPAEMQAEINHMIYMVGQEIASSNGLLMRYHPKQDGEREIYPVSLNEILQAKRDWEFHVSKTLSNLFNGQDSDVNVNFDKTQGSPARSKYTEIWNEILNKQKVLGRLRDDLEAMMRK